MNYVTKTTGNYKAVFLPANEALEMALIMNQIELLHEKIADLADGGKKNG